MICEPLFSGVNNKHALVHIFGVGHMIQVKGAVVVVIKCAPKTVLRVPAKNCSQVHAHS